MKRSKNIMVLGIACCAFLAVAVVGCGKKDEEPAVAVQVEKIDENGNVIAEEAPAAEGETTVAEDGTAANKAAASADSVKPADKNNNKGTTDTSKVVIPTEDEMKKIAKEQKENLEKISDGNNPVNPADIEPNFGPGKTPEDLKVTGAINPDLQPSFPSPGVKVEKQPNVDLKPNFPAAGQEGPKEGGTVPSITPSFPADGSDLTKNVVAPNSDMDPAKGNFPAEGQEGPSANR